LETVVRYIETICEIDDADRELRGILTTLRRAARTLPRDWATVAVLGIEQPVVPEVPATHRRTAIDSAQWPTIDEIARVLARMHRAHDAAEAAWSKLPPELQAQMHPPPEKFRGD
jgi:hypothetical protein